MLKQPNKVEHTGHTDQIMPGVEIGANQAAIAKELAKSGEAQQLMDLFKQTGGVQQATKAAVAGDTSQLMEMVQKVMQNPQGAKLIEQLNLQAKQAQQKQNR